MAWVHAATVLLLSMSSAGQAQTAVDGAISGLVASANTTEVVRIVRVAPDGSESLERVVPVRSDGRFLALRVPAGTYRVEPSLFGRMTTSQTVTVVVGSVSDVDLGHRLTQAAKNAKIADEAEDPWDGPDEAVPVDEPRAEDARDADAAEQASRGEQHPSAGALFSVRGLAPTQNRTLVDGLSGDQAFRGGTRGNASGGPRSDAFSAGSSGSVRSGSAAFTADYGGAAGVATAVSTVERSAGGALHGAAAYTVASNALAATNPFAVVAHYRDGVVATSLVKPEDVDQTFSGRGGGVFAARRLGGRLAGSLAVEEARRSFPAQASPATVGFYALTASQAALLATRGLSRQAVNAALNYLDGLTGPVVREADRGLEAARLGLTLGAHDLLTASYTRERLHAPAGSGTGAATAVVARGAASVGDETVRVDAVTGRWLHTFGGRTGGRAATNEVRGQFARDFEFETARPPLAAEPAIGPGGFAPQVAIYDGSGGGAAFTYGTPAALGRRAYPEESRVEIADIAQLALGRHVFSAGADWSRISERIDALNDEDGSYIYDSVAGTEGRDGGLVDWITDYTFNVRTIPNGGCPSINAAQHFFCFRSYAQSFGQSAVRFNLQEFTGFAQDRWRVRPGLAIDFGARYEYLLLPFPQRPNPALDAVFGASGATGTFPEDRNNVGPRVGLGWAPREGRFGSVRLGYGAFAGRLPGTTVRAALVDTALPAAATHIRITPETVTACPQVTNQGFGFPCAYTAAPPAAVAATTSATVFARGFRLPVVQVAALTLERGWPGVDVRATYTGAWATQLPKTTDLNIGPSSGLGRFVLQGGNGRVGVRNGEAFVVPVYAARVSTQYGAVTELESNSNATWNALTVEARGRLFGGLRRGGLTARGVYTWSKALDYGAEQGAVPQRDGQFDPFDVRYDKGVADTNVPQRFSGDLVWRTELRRGPEWLRAAAAGWRLAGIGSAASGRAYGYQVFGGTHLSGGGYSLNGSGGSAYLPTVGRNTLRTPARFRVDARVARPFRATERLRGEAFAEATNLTNHVSVSRVNDRAFLAGTAVGGVTPLVFQDAATVTAEGLPTTPFGAPTSSTLGGVGERRVRIGLRLEF